MNLISPAATHNNADSSTGECIAKEKLGVLSRDGVPGHSLNSGAYAAEGPWNCECATENNRGNKAVMISAFGRPIEYMAPASAHHRNDSAGDQLQAANVTKSYMLRGKKLRCQETRTTLGLLLLCHTIERESLGPELSGPFNRSRNFKSYLKP